MILLSAVGIAFCLWLGYSPETAIHELDYASRSERLMKTTPLVDGHNDLPYLLRLELKNKIYDTQKFDFHKGSRPLDGVGL